MNIINTLVVLPVAENCNILGESLANALHDVYNAIQIAVPIIVIALCTVDIARAVIAQDDKDMKAAQTRAIKRVIIGVAIFFVPILLDAILKLAGLATGTCDIASLNGPNITENGNNEETKKSSTDPKNSGTNPSGGGSTTPKPNPNTGGGGSSSGRGKYYCEKHNGNYYGIEGKKVSKSKYKKQCDPDKNASTLTVQQLFDAADSLAAKIVNNNFTFAYKGIQNTYEKALKTDKQVNCAKYISWVMQDVGLLGKGDTFWLNRNINASDSIKKKLNNKNNFTVMYVNKNICELVKKGTLHPGDIVGKPAGHTMIYRGEKNKVKFKNICKKGNSYEFISINPSAMKKKKVSAITHNYYAYNYPISIIIRPTAFE